MRELRTTTGQTISISYEAATNTVLFAEDDWFADPVRASAVPPRSLIRARAGAPTPAAPAGRARRPSRPTPVVRTRARRPETALHLVS
jgi:hypothetical protein